MFPDGDLVRRCGSPGQNNSNTSTDADADKHARGPIVDNGHMPERFKRDDGPPPTPRYPTLCQASFVNDPRQAQPSQVLVRKLALISAFQIR